MKSRKHKKLPHEWRTAGYHSIRCWIHNALLLALFWLSSEQCSLRLGAQLDSTRTMFCSRSFPWLTVTHLFFKQKHEYNSINKINKKDSMHTINFGKKMCFLWLRIDSTWTLQSRPFFAIQEQSTINAISYVIFLEIFSCLFRYKQRSVWIVCMWFRWGYNILTFDG